MLDDAEVVLNREMRIDMQKDDSYWESVAGQLGGTAENLEFIIRKSAERPTMVGGPEGYAVMAIIPVIRSGVCKNST